MRRGGFHDVGDNGSSAMEWRPKLALEFAERARRP